MCELVKYDLNGHLNNSIGHCVFRLSRPQYAVFNDKFGGAKSVEQLEHLSHELKSLVMVSEEKCEC